MRYSGIEIKSAERGADAIGCIDMVSPDILFINFPLLDADIGEVLLNIRKYQDIPIIIFSENVSVSEKARLLEAGADELIAKPINCIECLSVANALLRRTFHLPFKQEQSIYLNERVVLNLDTHELFVSGKRVHLTPIEFRLLALLTRNRGLVLTYQTLLERIWDATYSSDLDLLKKYIYNLRSKIEDHPHEPQIIVTERGLGYKLNKLI